MLLSTDLPTDSVLRRHATTESQRILGLPPTDSVLKRHYEQLMAAVQESGQAVAASAARVVAKAATPASSVTASQAVSLPSAAPTQPAARPAAAPSASGGGLMGWLRRLFGG